MALALFQAFGIAVALESQAGLVLDPGFMFRLTAVTTLVTGTMFLMWLGEQITERGVGNGISMIISPASLRASQRDRRVVRVGSNRRHASGHGLVHLRSGCARHCGGGVRRTWAAKDSGELCESAR